MRSVESDLPRLEYFPETPIFNIQFQIAIFKISENTKSGWGRIGHRKICCCCFLRFQLSSPLSLLKAESFVKSPSYHIKLGWKGEKKYLVLNMFFNAHKYIDGQCRGGFGGGKSADISDEWIEWWSLLHRRLLVLQVALFIGYGGGGWGGGKNWLVVFACSIEGVFCFWTVGILGVQKYECWSHGV